MGQNEKSDYWNRQTQSLIRQHYAILNNGWTKSTGMLDALVTILIDLFTLYLASVTQNIENGAENKFLLNKKSHRYLVHVVE